MSIDGGLRDRMIIESARVMFEDGLTDLGWFDTGRAHLDFPPMRSGPIDRQVEVQPNQLVLSFEDVDPTDELEIGSGAWEITHTGYMDFYAEPAPTDDNQQYNGGEALGKHVIGDVRGLLVGEMPAVGRDRNFLDVYDYSLATPELLFTVEIPYERVRTMRVHHASNPWERYWYTCSFELLEVRSR